MARAVRGVFLSGLFALLISCAIAPKSPPTGASEAAKLNPATAVVARDLYEGKPPAIYATQFPVASFQEGVERGDAAWRSDDLDLALYMFVQALSFVGPAQDVFAKIGTIHESRGNLQLASRAFEQAKKIAPDDVRILERLGLLYTQLGKNEDAEVVLRQVTERSQTRWRAYDALGLLFQRRGDVPGALGHFDRAAALEPGAAIVFYHRGSAYYSLGQEQQAETDFKRVLELGDTKSGAAESLGRILAQRKRYVDALSVLLINNPVAAAYRQLGEVAMANKDYDAAIRYLERARDESPSYDERLNRSLALAREYQRQVAADVETVSLTKPSRRRSVATHANIRVAPSLNAEVVGFVQPEDSVGEIRCETRWCLVEFRSRSTNDKRTGWIRATLLAP